MRGRKERRGQEIHPDGCNTERYLNPQSLTGHGVTNRCSTKLSDPGVPTRIGIFSFHSSIFESAHNKLRSFTADCGKLTENTLQFGGGCSA